MRFRLQMAARYAANKQIHWKKSEAAFRGILQRVDCAAGRLVSFQIGQSYLLAPCNLVLFFGSQKQRFARMTEKMLMMIMTVAMIIMMIMMTNMTEKHTIIVNFE